MKRIVMVYNADSGYFNGLADALHKMLSPATYACSLCAITYGPLAMKDEWRRFIESLEHPVTFIHRDEFLTQFGLPDTPLPVILLQADGNAPTVLVDAETIGSARSVSELKDLVSARLDVSQDANI